MSTHIVLNDEAMRLAELRSKCAMVDLALCEFIAHHRQRQILDLVGQNPIIPNYDVRAVRAGMTRDCGGDPRDNRRTVRKLSLGGHHSTQPE